MKYSLVLLACLLSGCTVTNINTPYWSMKRTSFLQKMEIPEISIATNYTATLKGYANDGGQDAVAKITGAMVEAAIKGAAKSVAPVP